MDFTEAFDNVRAEQRIGALKNLAKKLNPYFKDGTVSYSKYSLDTIEDLRKILLTKIKGAMKPPKPEIAKPPKIVDKPLKPEIVKPPKISIVDKPPEGKIPFQSDDDIIFNRIYFATEVHVVYPYTIIYSSTRKRFIGFNNGTIHNLIYKDPYIRFDDDKKSIVFTSHSKSLAQFKEMIKSYGINYSERNGYLWYKDIYPIRFDIQGAYYHENGVLNRINNTNLAFLDFLRFYKILSVPDGSVFHDGKTFRYLDAVGLEHSIEYHIESKKYTYDKTKPLNLQPSFPISKEEILLLLDNYQPKPTEAIDRDNLTLFTNSVRYQIRVDAHDRLFIDIYDPKTRKLTIRYLTEEKVKKFIPTYTEFTESDLPDNPLVQIHSGIYQNDQKGIQTDELVVMCNNSMFINNVKTSLIKLYKAKIEKYSEVRKIVNKAIEDDNKSINALKGDIDKHKINEMFPMLVSNKMYIFKIDGYIKEARKKINELTPELIKKNLLTAILDPDDGIVSLSGDARAFIREHLCRQIFVLSRGHELFLDSFNNLIFMGSAGVGKTKLAKTVGFVFGRIGILLSGNLIITSPKDMIGTYVGQTASKTAGVLMKGLESVILIDEAYQLMNCRNGRLQTGSTDYGPESITEIVNFLDKFVGMSIMIVAGYEREIKGCFLEANSGLDRRFPYKWVLPNYSARELFTIFVKEVSKRLKDQNLFDRDTLSFILTLITTLDEQGMFVNQAGDMVNLSGIFIDTYYGDQNYDWNDIDTRSRIITRVFNIYLQTKGYSVSL